MKPPAGLIDIPTAAQRLGVDVRFIRRLVFEKRLPYFKVGRYVRFDSADIDQWLNDRKVEAEHRKPA